MLMKVFVHGDKGVGKSSLISSFVHGRFDPYSQSAIGSDFQSINVNFDGTQVLTQLWEANVQFYHCVFLVYDVTDKSSFKSATQFLTRLETRRPEIKRCAPVLIIAHKRDLKNERLVSQAEGELLALHFNAMYTELSSYEPSLVRNEIGEFVASVFASWKDPTSLVEEYMKYEY